MPADWFAELEQDERTVMTALDIVHRAAEQGRRAGRGGRQDDEGRVTGG